MRRRSRLLAVDLQPVTKRSCVNRLGVRCALPAVVVAALIAFAGCGGGHHAKATTRAGPPASTTTKPAAARPGAKPADWTTYHDDLARTGAVVDGPTPAHARRLWSAGLDGAAYAEPLVVDGTVVVATENDSLYAFDGSTGRLHWRTHLGTPVAGGDLPCGDIDPSGITSTPVADARAGVVYAVAFESPAQHVLVAVNVADGAIKWRRPIDPPGSDPTVEQQRSALALNGGRIYVAYGGLYGDCGDYHGWVVAVSAGGDGKLLSYRVPAARRAGIWAPSGPAIDASGNVYVVTGNSEGSSFDFGNALIKLSPALTETGYFAPSNAVSLNGSDLDEGSIGALLIPGGRVFVIGKDGIGYLADGAQPGGVGGQLASEPLCSGGAFGGVAYSAGMIYVPCVDGVAAVRASASALRLSWRGPSFDAGPPVYAGGSVWTVALDQGVLYALDAATGDVRFHTDIGSAAQFSSPTVAGGRLYVVGGRRLQAFGSRTL